MATGLSAASTVEQAEDSARARALVVVGIESVAFDPQVRLLTDTETSEAARLTSANQDLLQAADELSLSRKRSNAWPEETLPSSEWQPETAEFEEISPAFPERESAPSAPSNPKAAKPKGQRNGRRTQPASIPKAPVPEVAPSEDPVDLSDIIAQTDVELKRLGWTNTQGRQYLQRTYNKRSRQQLTDEELLEFLHQLQTQTTADDPPF